MSQSLNSSRINSQNMPPGASKSLKYHFTLPANGQLTFDLQQQQASGQIENIQTVFIDNSGNAAAITLFSNGPNFNVVCPPYSQGMFPILVSSVPRFVLSGSGTGSLYFLNVPMPLSVWPVANPNTYSGGALVVSDSVLDATVSNGRVNNAPQQSVTLTSGSGTTPATPASTQLFAANAARRYYAVQAPATADMWINPLGGTAAVNGADCFRVPANSFYESKNILSNSTINYYCATGSLQFAAFQY